MVGQVGHYGAVDLDIAQSRRQRNSGHAGALASLCVLALCCAGIIVVRQRGSPSALEEAAVPEDSRQQQLADVFTAPLEGLARSVGHAIKSSITDGADFSSPSKSTMAADPWSSPTHPVVDPFEDPTASIPTYDYSHPWSVSSGTASSAVLALPTAKEMECYFQSDWFMRLVRSCCKTLYIPPGPPFALLLLASRSRLVAHSMELH